ncbi:hypothetical protein M4I33_07610 [Clostridium sp. LY3-2]|uniref:hypothetical protein n=1 Tax=Clostridium sp. LY3-2 TaxID=2942482 RepID=UPI0021539DA2|nr:hypothetical protein [Clostridium sp. LY3-2]MCR6514746.1 hypothetical protein [Clostridium sp. LY3-2]
MWRNKKILVILTASVITSYAFNFMVYGNTHLDKTVYRKVKGEIYSVREEIPKMKFIEESKEEFNEKSLDYFNLNDSRAKNIIFPEIGVRLNHFKYIDDYYNGKYSIKEIDYFSDDDFEVNRDNLINGEKVVTKAILNGGSDEEEAIDLGEIHLKLNEEKFNQGNLLKKIGMNFDDFGSYKNYKVKEDCYINNLQSNYIEELLKKGDLYINQQEIRDIKFPMYFSKDDIINIEYIFNDDNKDFVNSIVTDIVFEIFNKDLHNETIYFRVDTTRNDLSFENLTKIKEESNEKI